MLKPDELETEEGRDLWETFLASSQGDVVSLRRLIHQNPALSRAEFWYTPAIHFAVREGHIDAVRLLLEGGADPERNGLHDGSLIEMAQDRGQAEISILLERERDRRHRTIAPPVQHPGLRAIAEANSDLEPIDLAIWDNRGHGNTEVARLLLERGEIYDLTVASALGDLERVRQMLEAYPERIRETRPSGRRPLSAAIEKGHDDIARLLLERGADPNWEEPDAPKGRALHSASRAGKLWLVELLLAHGADPNSTIDSAGNALFAAATPEIKRLLEAHGATPDPYDTSWLEDEHADVRQLGEGPQSASRLGAAFTMIVRADRPDLLARLLDAGLRIPAVITGCQGYLLHNTGMLHTLLKRGMNPNLMNWQHQTLLHMVCHYPNGGDVERAAILLDAGADINAREEEYRSTPLGWAARKDAKRMVEFLLTRGAATNLPDDEPWATPLSWAERRGHAEVATILRQGGARTMN